MGRYISASSTTTLPMQQYVTDLPPGCCLWTVPSGISTVTFEVWGGGGAGAPKGCNVCQAPQVGGNGGAYTIKTVDVSPGTQYTICVGAGGPANFGSNCQGCSGSKSYITGTGLTNLCAEGGPGATLSMECGGKTNTTQALAYGGDWNFAGGYGYSMMGGAFSCICCTHSAGGASPFGGGESHNFHYHCCVYYQCGWPGLYPGGGGSSALDGQCCLICFCAGPGADGLVRIHY